MLEQKIYEWIIKYELIQNGDKIVLGVSGGPDSICMLDILHKILQKGWLSFEMVVAHVNHGLRENAIVDEMFVKDFCEKIEVPFWVQHAQVKELALNQKRGLEETGRIVRYAFFDEVAEKTKANKIAIAHNANDQAETVLMNLLRGTGMKGLVGMEPINGKYIRPLLGTKRVEIEAYLQQNGIVARHDESNDENTYTRNKLRNIVVPYLEKEFNPNLVETLQRLSSLAKEQEEYWENLTKKEYEKVCLAERHVTDNYEYNKLNNAEIIIDLKKFDALEVVLQKRIVFYAIQRIFGTTKGIEKIHIDDILKLCHRKIGNKYLTPNKNVKVAIENKQLKITAIRL